ncbi:transcription factor SPT20 homolog isoform X2 [Littorina saxatilis]|uniref:transcription factor SPT20 homolog isoform X2 n=1 Tax=Littorina saxatilis TaxID=31220 RepID=UPI0038B4235F
MESMEAVTYYAQYILDCSDQNPAMLLNSSTSSSTSKVKSLDQKLFDLYVEESAKQEEDQKLENASHLLGKLLKRECLNCLVLSLYPGNEGYSLMLRARSGVETETIKLPYEESEVLDFIDAAELPPFLLDLLEKAQVNVFYSGCVIVEVRDYRRCAPSCYDTHFVLLRPSAQSLLCDVNSLAAEFGQGSWSQDDLHQLEGELLLGTSEPLCLDPSPAVTMVATEMTRRQKMFNEPSIKRSMKRYSQVALNRKRKLAQGPAPKELRLLDFLHKKRDKTKTPAKTMKSVDTWRERSVNLAAPQDFEMPEHLFKVPERPHSPNENLIVVEEHRLERDPNQEHRMLAVISVYRQRLADGFVGRLYLDHDYSGDDSTQQGCACLFPLGIRQNVDRYLDQFRDLFTEEGRRLVKITTSKPGQAEQVMYTAIQSPAVAPQATPPVTGITITSAQALLKQATSMAATIASVGESGGASLAAKRNIPIQLSLSITPVSGATNILPAQGTNQASVTLSGQSNQSQVTSQRLKQLALLQRTTPSPMASPASTPTSTPQQIAAAIAGQQANLQKVSIPTPTHTPPPNSRTPTPTQHPTPSLTPTSVSSRRSSAVTLESLTGVQGAHQQTLQPQNISFVSQDPSGSGVNQGATQGAQLSNINLASLSGLPQGLNLQSIAGLSGVSLANLGLQHMQVSLSMPGIAVPVPITMINTNPSILQNQAGILTSSTSTGSSQAALVTMVTALPASSASSTSGTSTTGTMSSQQVVMSTGVGSNQTAVLPSGSGMLSLPVGLSGLTQLMPVTTKAQGGVGLRTPANLPQLLQLPGGQQSIQLLSLQQQQRGGQLKPGTLTAAITSQPQQGGLNRQGTGISTAVPLSSVSVLTSQQMSALTSLTMGKAGAGGAGQFIQLTGGAQGGVSNPQGGPQTLHTQLAFQKAGGGTGTLQFHQLQLKQATAPTLTPTAAMQSAAKSKSKKRGGATPPKSS